MQFNIEFEIWPSVGRHTRALKVPHTNKDPKTLIFILNFLKYRATSYIFVKE